MTNDDGRKPEGAPERSPKAGVGAPSGVDGNGPKRFSVQRKMAIVARLLRGEPVGTGGPGAERFIRTLKENLLWVRTFDTIEELRAALVEFATRYNETWLVARHGYRTPVQVRADQCRLDPNATANLKLAA